MRPRESVQVALTVIEPAGAPVVFRVAVLPSPESVPAVAFQPATVTGTPSGLLQVQVTVAGLPVCTLAGFAEQDHSWRVLWWLFNSEVGGASCIAILLHLRVDNMEVTV